MIVAENLHKQFKTRTGTVTAVSDVGFAAADRVPLPRKGLFDTMGHADRDIL